jgi:hypothetical protein
MDGHRWNVLLGIAGEHQRCGRVAENVHRPDRQPGCRSVGEEAFAYPVRWDRPAELVTEDKVVVVVGVSGQGAFYALRVPVAFQCVDLVGFAR